MVPVITKPTNATRITKSTLTAIHHVITKSLLKRTINVEIIKLDVSHRFAIFLIAETENRITLEGKVQFSKRLINNKTKK